MPKVAQYQADQVQTQVVSQPEASANVPSAAFGAPIARGIGDLGRATAEMTHRIDTTAAEEALVQFERDKNKLFFNPESGYFNTQGRNAYDNASAVSQAMVDLKKQYGDGLNQNARSLFDRAADAHISKGSVDIARHSSKGLKAWEVATIEASVENTLENASLYWNQPEALKVQRALGRQAVIDVSEMQGIGAEATNEKLQTYESSFAKASIMAAINTGAEAGHGLFEKMGDTLEGPDRIKIEGMIAKKAEAEKTQLEAQQSIDLATGLVGRYDSLTDIMNEVNKVEDPEFRKKLMQEVKFQHTLREKAENEAQSDAFDAAEEHVYSGGSLNGFKSRNPEKWQRLTAKQKKSLTKALSTGGKIETDWNAYTSFMTMTKAEQAKVNPMDLRHILGDTEFKKVVAASAAARNTGTKGDGVESQIGRTTAAQTKSAIEQILGKSSKWNDEKKAKADSFYSLVDAEVKAQASAKGQDLTAREFGEVLSNLTRSVTTERTLFGVDFLAPDKEQDISDIDPKEIIQLGDELRRRGIPVTSANLLKLQQQAAN